MKNALIAIVVFFAALAAAQSNKDSPFYVTSPLQGNSFKAGKKIEITWLNGMDQSVRVTLLAGNSPTTMQTTEYSFKVNGDDESYGWKVSATVTESALISGQLPTSINSQEKFAFQFQYKDKDGSTVFAYSDPFTITGGSVTAPVMPAASTTASSATASSIAPSSTVNSALSTSSPASQLGSSTGSPSSGSASSTSAAASVPNPENGATNMQLTVLLLTAPVMLTWLLLA